MLCVENALCRFETRRETMIAALRKCRDAAQRPRIMLIDDKKGVSGYGGAVREQVPHANPVDHSFRMVKRRIYDTDERTAWLAVAGAARSPWSRRRPERTVPAARRAASRPASTHSAAQPAIERG